MAEIVNNIIPMNLPEKEITLTLDKEVLKFVQKKNLEKEFVECLQEIPEDIQNLGKQETDNTNEIKFVCIVKNKFFEISIDNFDDRYNCNIESIC